MLKKNLTESFLFLKNNKIHIYDYIIYDNYVIFVKIIYKYNNSLNILKLKIYTICRIQLYMLYYIILPRTTGGNEKFLQIYMRKLLGVMVFSKYTVVIVTKPYKFNKIH